MTLGIVNKFLYLIFTSLFLIGCSQKTPDFVHIQGRTMGTTYSIKYNSQKNITPQQVSDGVEKLLKDFNQVASTYISDSEISLINKSDVFENKKVSKEMQFLIKRGFEIAKNTNEHFDPTIGPLVNLLGVWSSEKR